MKLILETDQFKFKWHISLKFLLMMIYIINWIGFEYEKSAEIMQLMNQAVTWFYMYLLR